MILSAERLESLKKEKGKILTVIPGAGIHSENNNAKLKPAVLQLIKVSDTSQLPLRDRENTSPLPR
jgi:hypothetical protein